MSAHDPPGAVKKAKASARVESSKKAHRYFTTVRAGCPPPALSTIRMNSLSAFVTLGELAVVQRLVLESLVKPGPLFRWPMAARASRSFLSGSRVRRRYNISYYFTGTKSTDDSRLAALDGYPRPPMCGWWLAIVAAPAFVAP